jgi:hypothetical protein
MKHDPMCPPQAIHSADPCHYCDLIVKVRTATRKDAARDLRMWIHDNHPILKGYADIYVEGALAVVEGKP